MYSAAAKPFVDIHTHHAGQDAQSIRILNFFYQDYMDDGIPARPVSLGLHPWHIGGFDLSKEALLTAAKNKNVYAIGEIGLDRLCRSRYEDQIQIFIDQCQIAERTRLPVVIHSVKSFDEMLRLKKLLKPSVPWIIHGFRGNAALAGQLTNAGFFLSYGAALQNAGIGLQSSLQSTPFGQLFFETDESDHSIQEVYEFAAKILQVPAEELTYFVYQNFQTVFDRYFDE